MNVYSLSQIRMQRRKSTCSQSRFFFADNSSNEHGNRVLVYCRLPGLHSYLGRTIQLNYYVYWFTSFINNLLTYKSLILGKWLPQASSFHPVSCNPVKKYVTSKVHYVVSLPSFLLTRPSASYNVPGSNC